MKVTVQEFGGACPTQATGFIDERAYYFRYRNGVASLVVSTNSEIQFGGSCDHVYAYAEVEWGDSMDGSLDFDGFKMIMEELVLTAMIKAKAEIDHLEALVSGPNPDSPKV